MSKQDKISCTEPKPIFIYGTLRALSLLAWALTGDATRVEAVAALVRPATVDGFARYSLRYRDYPAVVRKDCADSSVDGLLLMLETRAQRMKLDNFEGEEYKVTPVTVRLDSGDTIEADMYVWNGNADAVSSEPWDLAKFTNERLEDWLDLFEGMELVGDD